MGGFEAGGALRQRDRVLAFVIEQIARHGIAPTTVEIARELAVSDTRAKNLVAQLIAAGAIERTPGAVRGLRVRDVAECRMHLSGVLRRLGWIAADPLGEIHTFMNRHSLIAIVEHAPAPSIMRLEHRSDQDDAA